MNILSIYFLIFMFVVIVLYYLFPKYQQQILLAGSLFFYCYAGIGGIVYVFLSAAIIYMAALGIQYSYSWQKVYLKINPISSEEKKVFKKKIATQRKAILACAVIIEVAVLCYFKYSVFLTEQFAKVFPRFMDGKTNLSKNIIIPLGISFYTFQSIGYLADVYWEKIDAEKKFWRMLLFVSFFPQIIQGPISKYKDLSVELYKDHNLTYENFKHGLERVVWGFFKKMVIANTLSGYVSDVFANYSDYSGLTVLIGMFMYSVQIYADFSGYMDIVCGFCKVLDIRLTENFQRPYFSKSIAEYWRRWHISLGVWFKDYLYYPIAASKFCQKLSKKLKGHFNSFVSSNFPASMALVVVWLATGLWHGASWAYIAWGGINGLFIIFSIWMDPLYKNIRERLRISESQFSYRAFAVVRTFILVTFIKVLPEVGTLEDGIHLCISVFQNTFIPEAKNLILPFVQDYLAFGVTIGGTVSLFLVDLVERKRLLPELMDRWPKGVRTLILACVIMMVICFGIPVSNGIDFMYAQF